MIQIVQQFIKKDGEASFRFTSPPVLVPSLMAVFTRYNEIIEQIVSSGGSRENLFYTLGHHAGARTSTYPARTGATFEYQSVLGFDLDGIDLGRWGEYAAIVASAIAAPLDALTCINSGNGLHVIAGLKHPIRASKYFSDERDAYKQICKQMEQAIMKAGLPVLVGFKVDTSIFEPARVFRLPGSLNVKPGKENKECQLLSGPSEATLEIDLFKLSGLEARKAENVSPAELKRKYPKPDVDTMLAECKFVQWAQTELADVHEPHAFDFFSLMAPCGDAPTETGSTPRQLAEAVFVGATASASLKKSSFDEKWEQAIEYGGRKCSTIDAHWGKCSTCPHFGKIQTPLALKSKEHIASEDNGYWVLNDSGVPLYPAYEDLAKVHKAQTGYLFSQAAHHVYTGSHYEIIEDEQIKAWIESTVRPSEPLKEQHRNEFTSKLKAKHFLAPKDYQKMFVEDVKGRVNCANGVINVMTGAIEDHSPGIGFLYQLPYAVDLNAKGPEYFLDWLDTITKNRVELMDAILDMMAYCLWPSYDDHVFAYLIGDGANGKSTLIDLIKDIVGADAYSAVGLQTLCNNRFAPAQLEGKLVNISFESSGGSQELTSENLNILKTLSAGDPIMAERKGVDGFNFQNRAKLIFAANKAPQFRETGAALERRMLVIPFEHTIIDPDSRVGVKLREEIPSIVAFLVRRIRANVKKNGRFLVSRGGQAAIDARQKLLTEYNTVVTWARETLDTGASLGEAYIEVQAAFSHYQDWCAQSGYKNPQNRVAFGRSMCNFVLGAACGKETKIVKVAGRSARVYPFAKFKGEEGAGHQSRT